MCTWGTVSGDALERDEKRKFRYKELVTHISLQSPTDGGEIALRGIESTTVKCLVFYPPATVRDKSKEK